MGSTRPIRLLVVCTANTCRSPMAAALLTAELATSGVGAFVASAGTEGPAGRSASAASVEVMEEVGIDLTAHRSRVIDVAALEHADLVLVMTRTHERAVAVRSGRDARRVFLLSEFALLVDAAETATGGDGSGLDRMLRMALVLLDAPSRCTVEQYRLGGLGGVVTRCLDRGPRSARSSTTLEVGRLTRPCS